MTTALRAPVSLDPWWRRAATAIGISARRRYDVAAHHWRSSLQLRVVVTTLVASGIVVALFASLLVGQIGRGLVAAKTSAALVEARSGLVTAQAELSGQSTVSPDMLDQIVQRLTERGAAADLYTVVLLGSPDQTSIASAPPTSVSDVPPDLDAALASHPGPLYTFAPVPDPDGVRTQGLVVGSVLNVPGLGPYRLYHLFPLTNEQETLSLVWRATAVAGLLLVALLALVAWLVARQVVNPVRLAARTAARLEAGRLDERMRVRGEDELARLAQSFNSMARSLQAQIRQLEELSRVQRRFVSDVTHELRTPLTTVRMAADVLYHRRTAFPPDVRRSAELLQDELDRFEALLADLLEISRYDAGAAALDAAPHDVVDLVHRVVTAVAPLAERRRTQLDLSHVPHEPVVAEVDAVRVERVLRNLLVNAVEHSEGRPVQVHVATNGEAVAVLVRDHGRGFDAEQARQVFTRFWRADPSRTRATGGTGLGLSIALEDARLHGGWLQAAGRPGEGAAFLLTLPARANALVTASPLPLPWTSTSPEAAAATGAAT